jgi:uncharacterized protein
VIDCLEFSRDLRRLDPVDEMCFLTLEIERLGRPRLAAAMLDQYRIAMRDPIDEAAVGFYKKSARRFLSSGRQRYVQEPMDRVERARLARVGEWPLRQ